jgi:Cu(I)/Ag(I) efflux system membrane fusion protein
VNEQGQKRSPRMVALLAGAAVFVLAIGAGGYWLGANRASPNTSQSESVRRVLYWYDPMVPDQHFDRPGKSPFMDMQLVPRYADEASAEQGVRIDPGVAQNFGVRLATVTSAPLQQRTTAAGVIAFNDRNVAIVQARAGGFVERSYGRAIGDVVSTGAPLVDVRIPEWTAAQGEYLALRQGGGELASAARRRLAMLGMPESLIARVERSGQPSPVATISAPISGAITALDLRAGMTLTPGASVATINGVSPVWLVVSLPQADAALARRGARVTARIPAYPDQTFAGRIESVLPAADPTTRTVQVRIALANADGRLRPGMTAEAEIAQGAPHQALLVPAEAVIQTGRRTIVIVALDNGRFAPTEVAIGRRSGDNIEIGSGLSEGQRVVASGQFLIDSEASLSGALDRLQNSAAQQNPTPAAAEHEATGRLTAITSQGVTIAHGAVPDLNWPEMTMQFGFGRPDMGAGLRVGDEVTFRFHQVPGGSYAISEIHRVGARP